MLFRSLLAAVFCLSVLPAAPPAAAHDYTVGGIHIVHPWTRATPKGAKVAGGYMTLTNKGTEADRLVGGSSAVAGRFEIHEMRTVDGVMRMRPLSKGLEIKPGETVKLEPGSYHIMMMDLKVPVQQGKRVSGTLEFERAGSIEIEYVAEAIGGKPAHGQDHHGQDHHGH